MADNHDSLTCPACGGEMEKVFIESMQRHLDVCLKGCGGLFFDNREFEKVDEQHENIDEILNLVSGKSFTDVGNNELRVCSYCGANMAKINNFGVLLDVCYTCGGKFLDNNELEQYRNQFPSENERAKAFHSIFSEAIGKEKSLDMQSIAKQDVDGDKIVYCEPPMNPFKRFIVKLFNR